jgi:hypothetical protein
MTPEQVWGAILDLDPTAEVKLDTPGGWIVRLPNTVYEGPNAMCTVTVPYTTSRDQAVERMWTHLLSLQESGLHRDLGPSERPRHGFKAPWWYGRDGIMLKELMAAESAGRRSGHSYERVRWNGIDWVRIGGETGQ